MPWKVTGPMNERMQLVKAYGSGRHTVAELAEHYGVSRKTAHKWLTRYKEQGREGLQDRSHVALSHPNAVSHEVREAVIRAKLAHPTWGPLKLLPGPNETESVAQAWPAASTRGLILARAGLTRSRRRRRRVPPSTEPFSACDRPNAVWCADFKGWFRTADGMRCDPLTVTDAYSRMLLCCRAVTRPDYAHVRPAFESVFREYGLPQAIKTDNGPPFASTAVAGLSSLAVWWVKLGIKLERIDPGHPEQNGRHERMHRTLKEECCKPPSANSSEQQCCFDAFRHSYNTLRPHQSLGLQTPASWYEASFRAYPAALGDPVYPEGTQARRVRSNGQIRWRGRKVFISEALIGELVAVIEGQLGYEVYFGSVRLGRLDAAGERLIRDRAPFSNSRL